MQNVTRRIAPEWIILGGCLIALLSFGPRASVGLFQVPMTMEFGWGRDTFGLAIAIQNLLWGIGQPFAGAVADRFGLRLEMRRPGAGGFEVELSGPIQP